MATRIRETLRANKLLIAIGLIAIGVIGLSYNKLVYTEPTFVYVRVKLGQGYWWARTANAKTWLVTSIQEDAVERDLLGRPVAEVIGLRQYPTVGLERSEWEVFMAMKLAAGYNNRTGQYRFKRANIGVGSPIEFEFPRVYVTGTVLEISEAPFEDSYVDKVITLINRDAYSSDTPELYESIQVGDSYDDGTETVFEILDKELRLKDWLVPNNLTGELFKQQITSTQHIVLRAKIRLLEDDGVLLYAGEYPLRLNAKIPFTTDDYNLDGFVVSSIEDA